MPDTSGFRFALLLSHIVALLGIWAIVLIVAITSLQVVPGGRADARHDGFSCA